QKVLDLTTGDGDGDAFDRMLLRVIRSADDGEDMGSTVDEAQRLVRSRPVPLSYPRRAFLLVELGGVETWLGRLPAATAHLMSAVGMCTAGGFVELWPEAMSRLAIAEYLRGRTTAALVTATRLIATPDGDGSVTERCRRRAMLVLGLARQQTLPWALSPIEELEPVAADPDSDPSTALLEVIYSVRFAADRGEEGRTVF